MWSWTAKVTVLGVVVRIEQVVRQVPPVSLHRSQSPVKANSAPIVDFKTERLFRCVTEEPPIACFHTVEILLLDPASPFAGMTGLRPVP